MLRSTDAYWFERKHQGLSTDTRPFSCATNSIQACSDITDPRACRLCDQCKYVGGACEQASWWDSVGSQYGWSLMCYPAYRECMVQPRANVSQEEVTWHLAPFTDRFDPNGNRLPLVRYEPMMSNGQVTSQLPYVTWSAGYESHDAFIVPLRRWLTPSEFCAPDRIVLWSGFWAGAQEAAFLLRAASGRLSKALTNSVEQCGFGSVMNREQDNLPDLEEDIRTAVMTARDDARNQGAPAPDGPLREGINFKGSYLWDRISIGTIKDVRGILNLFLPRLSNVRHGDKLLQFGCKIFAAAEGPSVSASPLHKSERTCFLPYWGPSRAPRGGSHVPECARLPVAHTLLGPAG